MKQPSTRAVFISYASQDAEAVQRICDALHGAGIEVWFDQTGLAGGDAWDTEIRHRIRECALFVPVISAQTEQRLEGYFRLEWRLAEQRTHLMAKGKPFLIPVVIDDTRDDSAHVPETFLDVQWTRLPGGEGAASFAKRVTTLLAQAEVPPTAHGHSHPASVAATVLPKRPAIARPMVAAAAVLLAGAVAWWVLSGRWKVPIQVVAENNVAAAESTARDTSAPAPRTAVAVLPFANLTGDASKEYLGDGMAEELINTLNKVSGLKVPARTSSFAYKGRNTDIRQIARDLGVGTILEGSVRAAGKRIRITAQLINAQDGLSLWSNTYDEEFTNIFNLQDKLATQIATALQPSLGEAAQAVVAQGPPTKDVEAYNLYLQGWALAAKRGEQDMKQATVYFQRAIDRDPAFAAAYAGMAQAQLILGSFGKTAEHHAIAERTARQALTLNPQLAVGHSVLSSISDTRGQFMEMEAHMKQALALDANIPWIHNGRALQMLEVGRLRAMQEEAQKAYALAPASPNGLSMAALSQWYAGHDDEAQRLFQLSVALGGNKELVLPAAHRAPPGAAQIYGSRFTKADPGPEEARASEVVRLVNAALADPTQRSVALASRTRLFPKPGNESSPAPLSDAGPCLVSSWSYAMLGALDVAYDLADQCLGQMVRGQTLTGGAFAIGSLWVPELRPFRQDPRFQSVVSRLGLMEYWQLYGPPDLCELKNDKLICH